MHIHAQTKVHLMTMWLKKQRGHDQHAAITTTITTSITTSSVAYHGGPGRDPGRVGKGGLQGQVPAGLCWMRACVDLDVGLVV